MGTFGTFCAGLGGFIFAAAGAALVLWLLWQLWKRIEVEEEIPSIEIGKAEPTRAPEPLAIEAVVEEEKEAEVEESAEEISVEVEEEIVAEPAAPDDLKRIEGIGPKISSVLQEAGISTFVQLADTAVSQIEQILEAKDPRLLRLADPTSWPEQAALAAAGEWDALEALQGELKGGRRA